MLKLKFFEVVFYMDKPHDYNALHYIRNDSTTVKIVIYHKCCNEKFHNHYHVILGVPSYTYLRDYFSSVTDFEFDDYHFELISDLSEYLSYLDSCNSVG